jgi:L-amino acid N-acyltransferase YncA
MTKLVVRAATSDDVPSLNRIYNTYIVDSHVSFDTEPWTDDQRAAWFADRVALGYPVVVAERDGVVIGASWSGPWRDKAAYRATVETTVVLAAGESGAGMGSVLYRRMHDDLRGAGFRVAIGVIALPNDASIALHRKLGYRDVGVLDDVGFKDGMHYSTMLMQKDLRPPDGDLVPD